MFPYVKTQPSQPSHLSEILSQGSINHKLYISLFPNLRHSKSLGILGSIDKLYRPGRVGQDDFMSNFIDSLRL